MRLDFLMRRVALVISYTASSRRGILLKRYMTGRQASG